MIFGENASIATIKDDDEERLRQRTQTQRDLAVRLASASVTDAIGLMLRSERHRGRTLADLEWLLLPPLMLDQIAFSYVRPSPLQGLGHQPSSLQGTHGGSGMPIQLPPVAVAMVTWAMVSSDTAATLNAQKKSGEAYRLAPHEWRNGKEIFVIDMLGKDSALQELLQGLRQRTAE